MNICLPFIYSSVTLTCLYISTPQSLFDPTQTITVPRNKEKKWCLTSLWTLSPPPTSQPSDYPPKLQTNFTRVSPKSSGITALPRRRHGDRSPTNSFCRNYHSLFIRWCTTAATEGSGPTLPPGYPTRKHRSLTSYFCILKASVWLSSKFGYIEMMEKIKLSSISRRLITKKSCDTRNQGRS